MTPAFFLDKGQVVRIGREPMKVEILNAISGVTFAECYARRVQARIGALKVNFIDLPDLLTNKRATGRMKDAADIENLPSGIVTRRRKTRDKGKT